MEEAISNIPLSLFHSTMKDFCNNYKLTKPELMEKIKEYIQIMRYTSHY